MTSAHFDPFEFGTPISGELAQHSKMIKAVWQADEITAFKTSTMVENAQTVLTTNKLPEEAYLGALAVLMFNNEI